MLKSHRQLRLIALPIALAGISACAGGAYTGPVEVTRFVADQPAQLGQGTISLRFSEDLKNEAARDAFRAAVGNELASLGYTIVGDDAPAGQRALVETQRSAVQEPQRRNSPVSVGVGGRTGSFGSGLGLGVGINLGGGSSGPRVTSRLSVRIEQVAPDGSTKSLWEGRAQLPTSINSPYAPVEINAQTLAAALFKDFPGGNGETVTIQVEELNNQP